MEVSEAVNEPPAVLDAAQSNTVVPEPVAENQEKVINSPQTIQVSSEDAANAPHTTSDALASSKDSRSPAAISTAIEESKPIDKNEEVNNSETNHQSSDRVIREVTTVEHKDTAASSKPELLVPVNKTNDIVPTNAPTSVHARTGDKFNNTDLEKKRQMLIQNVRKGTSTFLSDVKRFKEVKRSNDLGPGCYNPVIVSSQARTYYSVFADSAQEKQVGEADACRGPGYYDIEVKKYQPTLPWIIQAQKNLGRLMKPLAPAEERYARRLLRNVDRQAVALPAKLPRIEKVLKKLSSRNSTPTQRTPVAARKSSFVNYLPAPIVKDQDLTKFKPSFSIEFENNEKARFNVGHASERRARGYSFEEKNRRPTVLAQTDNSADILSGAVEVHDQMRKFSVGRMRASSFASSKRTSLAAEDSNSSNPSNERPRTNTLQDSDSNSFKNLLEILGMEKNKTSPMNDYSRISSPKISFREKYGALIQ